MSETTTQSKGWPEVAMIVENKTKTTQKILYNITTQKIAALSFQIGTSRHCNAMFRFYMCYCILYLIFLLKNICENIHKRNTTVVSVYNCGISILYNYGISIQLWYQHTTLVLVYNYGISIQLWYQYR